MKNKKLGYNLCLIILKQLQVVTNGKEIILLKLHQITGWHDWLASILYLYRSAESEGKSEYIKFN